MRWGELVTCVLVVLGCTNAFAAQDPASDDVAALVRRGDAYRKTNQHDRAIQEYNEAIRLAPKEALAYFNRGLAYEALGHDVNALVDFTAAVKLNPKSSALFERRATVYFRMGLYDRAGSDYAAAVFLDPKNAAALYGRGITQRMDRFSPASAAEADIAAAKAVQADIADEMSARGVK
jgi:tetratricopeptide (TPR) repeat protein